MEFQAYHRTGGKLLGTTAVFAMPEVGDIVPVKIENGNVRVYQVFGVRLGAVDVGPTGTQSNPPK